MSESGALSESRRMRADSGKGGPDGVFFHGV